MTRRKRFTQRSGFTLVEMIAAFSVLFVLAVTSAQLLSAVTRVGVAAADRRMTQASVQRFADQVHADRSDAAQIRVRTGDDWQLTITTDTGDVRYRFVSDEASIRRTVTRDDAIVVTDRYILANDASPTVDEDDDVIQIWLRRSATVTWMVEVAK